MSKQTNGENASDKVVKIFLIAFAGLGLSLVIIVTIFSIQTMTKRIGTITVIIFKAVSFIF